MRSRGRGRGRDSLNQDSIKKRKQEENSPSTSSGKLAKISTSPAEKMNRIDKDLDKEIRDCKRLYGSQSKSPNISNIKTVTPNLISKRNHPYNNVMNKERNTAEDTDKLQESEERTPTTPPKAYQSPNTQKANTIPPRAEKQTTPPWTRKQMRAKRRA